MDEQKYSDEESVKRRQTISPPPPISDEQSFSALSSLSSYSSSHILSKDHLHNDDINDFSSLSYHSSLPSSSSSSLTDSITVVARIRPETDDERHHGLKCIDSDSNDERKLSITLDNDANRPGIAEKKYSFLFDRIFDDYTTQADLFDSVGLSSIDAIMNGKNASILAYGQTGSGKSYSMFGPGFASSITNNKHRSPIRPSTASSHHPSSSISSISQLTQYSDETESILKETDIGLIPRILHELFRRIETESSNEKVRFTVRCAYIEIYLERVKDLLSPTEEKSFNGADAENLVIRADSERGLWLPDVTEITTHHLSQCLALIKLGNKVRRTAATKSNPLSSRSHAIFIVTVIRHDDENKINRFSQLYLTDLAGSEKLSKTEATGLTAREGNIINASLLALGNVINALTTHPPSSSSPSSLHHIPYRNSKLTRILQNSIGGNSKTTVIICLSPSSVNDRESLSTLRFGARMKLIKNHITINESYTNKQLLKFWKAEKEENHRLRSVIKLLEIEVKSLKEKQHFDEVREIWEEKQRKKQLLLEKQRARQWEKDNNDNNVNNNVHASENSDNFFAKKETETELVSGSEDRKGPIYFHSTPTSSSSSPIITIPLRRLSSNDRLNNNNNSEEKDNPNPNNNNNTNTGGKKRFIIIPKNAWNNNRSGHPPLPPLNRSLSANDSSNYSNSSSPSISSNSSSSSSPLLSSEQTSPAPISSASVSERRSPPSRPFYPPPPSDSLRELILSFVCPLTKQIMLDPVIASDGVTYEREAIEKYFEKKSISPITGLRLPSKLLLPNKILLSLIKKFAYDAPKYRAVDYFSILPIVLLNEIFSCLDAKSLSRVSITCKDSYHVANNDKLWRIHCTTISSLRIHASNARFVSNAESYRIASSLPFPSPLSSSLQSGPMGSICIWKQHWLSHMQNELLKLLKAKKKEEKKLLEGGAGKPKGLRLMDPSIAD